MKIKIFILEVKIHRFLLIQNIILIIKIIFHFQIFISFIMYFMNILN